jgi:hypothetical protein
MSPNTAPLSRRATVLQAVLLSLFALVGAAILIGAVTRGFSGAWPFAGAAKVALLGAGLFLVGAAGVRGLFLSEGASRPSLLARSYYHSRSGRLASQVAGACIFGWLALRLVEAL